MVEVDVHQFSRKTAHNEPLTRRWGCWQLRGKKRLKEILEEEKMLEKALEITAMKILEDHIYDLE